MAKGATSRRFRKPFLAALLGAASLIVFFSGVGVAAVPPVEGTGSTTVWTNSSPSITTAESVTFKNTSMVTPHGVHWNAPPATPNCPNVPVDSSDMNWTGDCSFSQAGSYPFVCTVHPAMTGTVTVNSTGPQAPTVTTGSATSVTQTGARLNG